MNQFPMGHGNLHGMAVKAWKDMTTQNRDTFKAALKTLPRLSSLFITGNVNISPVRVTRELKQATEWVLAATESRKEGWKDLHTFQMRSCPVQGPGSHFRITMLGGEPLGENFRRFGSCISLALLPEREA